MDALHRLAEERLREALESGRLETGAYRGRPLPRDAAVGVPEDLRPAWRVLKSAGYVPEELEARREVLRIEDLLACCEDPADARVLRRRLNAQQLRYALLRERRGGARVPAPYAETLARHLGGSEEYSVAPGSYR